MEKTRIVKLTTTFIAMLAVIMSSFAMFPQASDAANNKNKPTEVNQMLTLINDFRAKNGLQKVKVNTTLTTTAGNWAGYLADTKDYDKYSDFVTKAPAGWSSPGEIKGSTSPGSVNYLFEEWAKSPAHANVIKKPSANIVGIGLAYDNSGTLHGTLNFFNYAKEPAGTYTTFPGGTTPTTPKPTTPTKPKQVFTDVNSSVIFKKEIETLASKNVSTGWYMKNGTQQYRPYEDVKRDAMIVFIYRAMGSPAYTPPKKSPFSDVSTSNVFYKEIAWAYENGITEGWRMKDGTRQFRPFEPVKRDAVAAFLTRAAGEKAPVSKTAPFSDVPTSLIFSDEIAWMKKTGISTGWKHNNTYQPYSNTKRDAMAAFIIRWMNYTGYKGSGSTVPSSFKVSGSGFGHGVGMSQYGAEQMARNGKTAEQILEYYYNPAQLEYSSSYANSDIRVQLIISSYQKITPVGGSMTLSVGGKKYTTSQAVDITLVNGVREYTINESKVRTSSSLDTLTWTNLVRVDRANGSSKPVNYKYGSMRLSTIGSQINVSNVLKVNTEYLYGLAEMPASWSQASLQAQAVAGRTYAMRNMSSVKASCDCNVYDEVQSQKFTGYDVISGYKGDNWKQAVDNTVRKSGSNVSSAAVMKYNGVLIDAVYSSSSSGGRTQSGKDMWGGDTVYLQSRNDPYSTTSLNPNRSWTVNVSQSRMNSIFGLKNIVEVKITKNSSGYAQTITAVDQDGKSKSVSGAQFRNALGLKSTGVSSITG